MIIEAKKQIPEKKSEWVFVRRNSKGENIFRRNTNQTAEYVANVLNDKEIPFVYSEAGSCFRIYNETKNSNYQYYPTTGRWGVYFYQKRPTKHYHSKSIEDFLERFFLSMPFKEKEMTVEKKQVRARPSDPTTSHEAAEKVVEFSAKMYKKIHAELQQGEGTYEELADRLSFRRDQLCKRLPEMQRIGIVELTGEKRAGSSGRMQRVWRATKE